MDSNRERQLENQIERLRTSERREIEKIGFLEGELAVKEVEIKRVFEENINLNKEISAFNNKIFDYELELKKLRMENQLMVKEKTLIINRF